MVRRLKPRRSLGFTLLEMMIVIIIMGILLSIAIPIYNQSLVRARESVLHNDLFELRHLIYQYTLDKQKAPQSLDDLVSAGYIKQIPRDPMTGDTGWEPQQEDVLLSVDQ
ncbi:MAG: prepilin-type N-terminal cleavage/methylation domain-containing protein, partial [Candidatus Sulfotelmatobacter sp.]